MARFKHVNRMEALVWLKCMGVSGLSPLESRALSNEEVIEKLRYALWDSQRIDNLFHGKTYQNLFQARRYCVPCMAKLGESKA